MMEQIFTILITALLITILLSLALPLINNYNRFMKINYFASDLKGVISMMDNLKTLSDKGSFLKAVITVPQGYEVTFNNETNNIEVKGDEQLNLTLNHHIVNELSLNSGRHEIQLYYGALSYEEILAKTNLVVFN